MCNFVIEIGATFKNYSGKKLRLYIGSFHINPLNNINYNFFPKENKNKISTGCQLQFCY